MTKVYGLFEKKNGAWIQLHPEMEYGKKIAIEMFSHFVNDAILLGGRNIAIRPVTESKH